MHSFPLEHKTVQIPLTLSVCRQQELQRLLLVYILEKKLPLYLTKAYSWLYRYPYYVRYIKFSP